MLPRLNGWTRVCPVNLNGFVKYQVLSVQAIVFYLVELLGEVGWQSILNLYPLMLYVVWFYMHQLKVC